MKSENTFFSIAPNLRLFHCSLDINVSMTTPRVWKNLHWCGWCYYATNPVSWCSNDKWYLGDTKKVLILDKHSNTHASINRNRQRTVLTAAHAITCVVFDELNYFIIAHINTKWSKRSHLHGKSITFFTVAWYFIIKIIGYYLIQVVKVKKRQWIMGQVQ